MYSLGSNCGCAALKGRSVFRTISTLSPCVDCVCAPWTAFDRCSQSVRGSHVPCRPCGRWSFAFWNVPAGCSKSGGTGFVCLKFVCQTRARNGCAVALPVRFQMVSMITPVRRRCDKSNVENKSFGVWAHHADFFEKWTRAFHTLLFNVCCDLMVVASGCTRIHRRCFHSVERGTRL